MKDFIDTLGNDKLIELSADLQVQLERGTGTRPVLWLLCHARRRAADALTALSTVDVTKTESIMTLQSVVQSYRELMDDCKALLDRGREADRQIAEAEREALSEALSIEELRAIGLEKNPEDS